MNDESEIQIEGPLVKAIEIRAKELGHSSIVEYMTALMEQDMANPERDHTVPFAIAQLPEDQQNRVDAQLLQHLRRRESWDRISR